MKTDMHFGAGKKTFQFAAMLRKNMTPAEKYLWKHLRLNALGFKFRAQHPLYRYVVDFYCHKIKLVIEADGSIHSIKEVQLNDKDREQQIISLGLHIIRFDNETIMQNIQFVLDSVLRKIEELRTQSEFGNSD